MELYSINLIKGFMVGVEYEFLGDEEFLIFNFGLIQVIFVW
jgi:hypothetical protein